MVDRAFEQPGDCRKVDVGVRAHVHAAAEVELRRPELVDENEWADHGAFLGGENPSDLELAEIVGRRLKRKVDLAHCGSP